MWITIRGSKWIQKISNVRPKCGSQFKIKYEIIDPPVSNYLNINISNIAIPEISDTAELKNKEF